MKCKYINKHACCVGCKNDDETGNLECISHELEKHSELFMFEKFWKENLYLDTFYDKNSNIIFELTCLDETEFFIKTYLIGNGNTRTFSSSSLIEVCEQALKYKEENETEIKS